MRFLLRARSLDPARLANGDSFFSPRDIIYREVTRGAARPRCLLRKKEKPRETSEQSRIRKVIALDDLFLSLFLRLSLWPLLCIEVRARSAARDAPFEPSSSVSSPTFSPAALHCAGRLLHVLTTRHFFHSPSPSTEHTCNPPAKYPLVLSKVGQIIQPSRAQLPSFLVRDRDGADVLVALALLPPSTFRADPFVQPVIDINYRNTIGDLI